jgi:hypothetical protein
MLHPERNHLSGEGSYGPSVAHTGTVPQWSRCPVAADAATPGTVGYRVLQCSAGTVSRAPFLAAGVRAAPCFVAAGTGGGRRAVA